MLCILCMLCMLCMYLCCSVNDVWLSTGSGISNSYGWSWNIISGSNYTGGSGDGSPVSYAAVNATNQVAWAGPGTTLCYSSYNNILFDFSGQDESRGQISMSTDGGQHWNLTFNTNFSRREDSLCITDPHSNSMLLLGGEHHGYPGSQNEVWFSPDAANTWIQLNNAPWQPRAGLTGTAIYSSQLGKTVVYITGGMINELQFGADTIGSNDVWMSSDFGASWTQLWANGSAPFYARSHARMTSTPSGVLILTEGMYSDATNSTVSIGNNSRHSI